jgi:hypothetical protein
MMLPTVGLDLPRSDVFNFLVAIGLLTHDLQIFALVFGLGVQVQELLLGFLRVKFNEDAALEDLVVRSP